jgi:ferredoxin-NADP reductase
MISAPADRRLAFCIRLIKGGKLSILLSVMPIGARIFFSGPSGHFFYRSSPRPVVFAATGTGIAPFVSMARGGIRGFTLLHGIREVAEAYFSSLFSAVCQAYIPCISGQPLNERLPPGAFPGRVTDYLDHDLPKGTYDFYLSGRGDMIRDAVHIIDRRFPDSLVFTETFY